MPARVFVLLLLLPSTAFAQAVAIRAGNLVDPATGNVAKNQIILVRDGKITEVGPSVQDSRRGGDDRSVHLLGDAGAG